MSSDTLRDVRPLPRARAFDVQGVSLTALSGLSAGLIALMVAVILGDIVGHGWQGVTREFLAGPPRNAMTEGGIFPAIYGTVLLVLLMVVALIPFGVGARTAREASRSTGRSFPGTPPTSPNSASPMCPSP